MPGVGRNSYKADMKKAKAKTNKKKTPLKMGHAKKKTRTTSKVGPGGQSPKKGNGGGARRGGAVTRVQAQKLERMTPAQRKKYTRQMETMKKISAARRKNTKK